MTTILKNALVLSLFAGLSFQSFAQQNVFSKSISRNPKQTVAAPQQKSHSKSNSRINTIISRPGNSQDFSTMGTGGWQHETNSTYTYDPQGRLTQRLYIDPTTGQNLRRNIIQYDAQGNEIEFRNEDWNGTVWIIGSGDKKLITYNLQNLKTETIFQYWNNSTSQWVNEGREQIVYDSNNRATTITNSGWNNGSWQFMDRVNLSHVNGTATSAIIQEYNIATAAWEDVARALNISWAVLYEIPSAYIIQYLDNNTWVNEEKYNAIYNPNGGYVGVYESWNDVTNVWENSSRETETYDSQKNFTGWKDESWDNTTNTWVFDNEEQEVLTYNGIDITQRIFRNTYNASGMLQDIGKEVYSNFQTFTVSGLKTEAPEIAVNVYPNPASENLTISTLEKKGISLTATLTDITGKTLLTKSFKAGEAKQLNIEALPHGIYLLQLQTEIGSTVKRIVKQ